MKGTEPMNKPQEYEKLRTAAQARADKFGLYFRLEWNEPFGYWHLKSVPWPKNQYGSDCAGELIQPSCYFEGHWS
jgi:hypothetical protein